MGKVLGKVTSELDIPRGPDCVHRITVAEDWLFAGATVEFELPRNLTCAECQGGGCDACGRSGAVSTRGRKEPAELVTVTLPATSSPDVEDTISGSQIVVVRLPEHGGLPEDGDLPRGILMLQVKSGTEADASAQKVSLTIPPPAAEPPAAPAEDAPPSNVPFLVAAAAIAIILIALWLAIR